MRNKTKSQNTFPPPHPSSQAQLHSWILYLPPTRGTGEQRVGVGVSSSHLFPAAPSSSGGGLLALQLLHHGVPSTGCSPSGTDCSSMGPPRGYKSGQKTCSSLGSSLHRATAPARSLLQCGLPTGSQPPPGIPLLQRGVLPRLQVEICSPVDLPGLQGHSLPHHGLPHGLQGNLCSSAWSIFSPPSALTWGSAGLFL